MGKHYFGYSDGSFTGRFHRKFSDDEFQALLNELGGELPRGILVWHLEDKENIENSERVRAIAQFPIVTGSFGNWLDPAIHLPKIKSQQAREIPSDSKITTYIHILEVRKEVLEDEIEKYLHQGALKSLIENKESQLHTVVEIIDEMKTLFCGDFNKTKEDRCCTV
jgi:hypothetical protein